MTMRTPNQDAALSAFIDAATSDNDLGYPSGAVFVGADDSPEAARQAWRYIVEGRPTVLINDNNDVQLLIEPFGASFFNRLRGRVRVQVSYRQGVAPAMTQATSASPSVRAELNRHALERFDGSALISA